MTKTKTHFEQVPLHAIKKIAEKDEATSGKAPLLPDNLTVERPSHKTESYSVANSLSHSAQKEARVDNEHKQPWQQLCEQAAKEDDPERLMSLVKEISRLLDEQLKQKPSGHAA